MSLFDKSSIRAEKLALRMAMDETQHRTLSGRIVASVTAAIQHCQGMTALYVPVRGEVDIASLLYTHHTCLPVVVAGSRQLLFRVAAEGVKLEKNAYGILQPTESAPECIPEIIIVPLLAFDRRGYRIGYGGGYYDTTLNAARQKQPVMAIGVAFAFQEVPHVPENALDAMLNMIITEKETIPCP